MSQDQLPSEPKAKEPPSSMTPTNGTLAEPAVRSLEQVQTDWQASWKYEVIEWLRASAGLAAVLGLFASVIYNSAQLSQLAASRDDERFDKAVSRFGSLNATERLTGLVGLQLFLEPSHKDKHHAVLLFLGDALAIEKEPTVRSAILDVFVSLSKYRIDQAVLNDALTAERDRNRGILANLHLSVQEPPLAAFPPLIRIELDNMKVGDADTEQRETLRATATAIAALVRSGAYVQDLSSIYCESCVFSSDERSVNLPNIKFDGSYLRQSTFSRVTLENASFYGADLVHADFRRAYLRGAKFTDRPFYPRIPPPARTGFPRPGSSALSGPIFECADLTEADFTGSTMFGFYWTAPTLSTAYYPRFFGANVSRIKLESFSFYIVVPLDIAKDKDTPGDIFPLSSGTVAAGGIVGDGGAQYRIIEYEILGDGQISTSIPPSISPSVYEALSSLNSANNLADATIPEGLRTFMKSSQRFLSSPSGKKCSGELTK